jgi:membrane protein
LTGVWREKASGVCLLLLAVVLTAFRRLVAAVQAFAEQRGALMASAVSFWGLLSIPPLMLLGLSLFGYVLRSDEEAFHQVMEHSRSLLPGDEALVRDALEEVARRHGSVGGVGLATLAWTGSQALVTLESALNAQWGVRGRPFLASRLLALLLVMLVGLLFLVSTLATGWLAALARWRAPWPGGSLDRLPVVWQVASRLLPLAVSTVMFTLLYRLLPNRPVSWRAAASGALVAATAWEAAKYGYAALLARLAGHSPLYGSLSAVTGLVLWTYYTAVIILVGSEWVRLRHEAAGAGRDDRSEPRRARREGPRRRRKRGR